MTDKTNTMPIERVVMIVAGTFVLTSILLSLFYVHEFIYLAVFVGASLLFSGITGFCPMVLILRKLGLKHGMAFR